MLINEHDDEGTLEEEEALSENDNANEIDDLQKEGEMPLEELLAMYGYQTSKSTTSNIRDPESTASIGNFSRQDSTADEPSGYALGNISKTHVPSDDTTGTSDGGSWTHGKGIGDDEEYDDEECEGISDFDEEWMEELRRTTDHKVGDEW